MRPNSIIRIAACLLLSFLAFACSSNAEVALTQPSDALTGGKDGSGGGGTVVGTGGGTGIDFGGGDAGASGAGGAGPDPNNGCKNKCDADECGPIADGCGNLIDCGGCTAPETCGGAGVPSHCGGGTPVCDPKTCADLGAECGLQADGCGGVLDCWSAADKAGATPHCSDPAADCVDGTCTVTTSCTKLTCADYATSTGLCGPVTDGCGGTLDCGFSCAITEVCGANEPGKCGAVVCTPETSCEKALAGKPQGYCGFVPDGCGGEIKNCAAACTGNETCGGGGTPDVCGHGTTVCVPTKTIADCGAKGCGSLSDGCGGVVDCGGCSVPETCGGGGVASQCGAPVCQFKDPCAAIGGNCGKMADGCGGPDVTCGSGSCGANQICNANVCTNIVCQPLKAADVCTGLCGTQSDGCGGSVDCGACTGNNTCGGGGTPNVCGSPPCTKLTCQDVGATCGAIGDGCGGSIPSCGSCTGLDTCGGGGVASKCGHTTNPNCTGLCQNQVLCSTGNETRLTGTVYAPNGTEPLYNALVYVPNAPLPTISTGPSCVRCQDEDLGNPIAAAITGADGKFVLKNVPAGVSFPLVVKMGKWRRVVTISPVPQCTNLDLTVDQTRLPRSMTDASAGNVSFLNIPHMAMVTGDVDALECVLRKIGLDLTEFTLPTGTGRVHMYRANGGNMGCTAYNKNGSCTTAGMVNAPLSTLFSGTTLDNYDVGIFGCEGGANEHNTYDPILRSFADRGGRAFASHYSYTYLHDNGSFANTATWGGPYKVNDTITPGIIDRSFAKGAAFNAWLGNVNAWHPTYGSGYISITDPRDYVQAIKAGSERFVYTDSTVKINGTAIDKQTAIQEYSFNTPVGSDADHVCGRVLYSAFHVAGISGAGTKVFPTYCSTGPLTPQEKVLEFMIFDLSACVSVGDPPAPPTCTKKTCSGLGANCGPVADGCGGLLDCGTCTAPNSCGGGGVPNQCGSICKRTSCGAKGANCGVIGDGCGGTLDCGTCTTPAICGGGGTANVCGVPQCQPRSCSAVGAQCGPISDGCGGTVNCGTCPTGTVCGGGGTPNVCGTGSCNPKTCTSEGAQCGFIGDGCGGTVACGTCPTGATCGAGGPNICGGSCTPRSCASVGAQCGFIGDGCGGVLDCGTCVAPQICGGAGVASQCGGSCTPRTCAQAGAACGAISDGCGSVLQCGVCPSGSTCGGNGVANQCGAGSCTPKTCTQANAQCGSVGDGCGNVLNCGTCTAPQSCGGAGVPNQCGQGTSGCVPLTCAQQNANCGPAADGCGGLLDCGTCSPGTTCGGGGIASQCGAPH